MIRSTVQCGSICKRHADNLVDPGRERCNFAPRITIPNGHLLSDEGANWAIAFGGQQRRVPYEAGVESDNIFIRVLTFASAANTSCEFEVNESKGLPISHVPFPDFVW